MIPNVNQFTEQLRMMPDQALQRMAMMYKQDPYIFPMVISEDIARKKMRAAAQAQMAQPQPKVADQAIMAMGQQPQPAPGIAGLQAPNMERMADGGIAGYAEGGVADSAEDSFSRGGMFDFTQRSEPVVRMAEGGAVQRYQDRGLVSTTGTLAQVQAPVMENLQALQAQLVEAERVLAAAARSGDAQSVTQYAQAVQKLRDQINQTAEKSFGNRAQQVVSELQAKPTAPSDEAIRAAYGPSANRMPQVQTPAAAGSASGTGARPPAAGAAPAAARAPSEGGIYALTGRMFDPVAQELKGLRGRMMMDAERRSDEELMQYEAGKPKGKIAEELEKTLRKEEEGATGERKQAAATAIFNAGLAMMAGTSPRALENIAKGAMAGSAQYGEALKDLKKASKERQKMLADIEQARRAEARDDHKTAMEYLRRRNEREERADGFFLEASAKLGFSKADAATRLYGTQMETESRERTASRSDPLALFKALGDGDVKKGYQAAQEMKGEPGMIRQLAMEAVKNPAQLKVLESTNPQLYNQIIAEINKLGGGAAGAGLDLSQWGSPQQVGGR